MPYATLHLVGPERDRETKVRLMAGTTDILVDVLKAVRPLVAVRIVEEKADNWSVAGKVLNQMEDASGALAVVTIAETAADEAQIAYASTALAGLLKSELGSNSLPPYVVFELVGEHAWAYKGRTIKQIKSGAINKPA